MLTTQYNIKFLIITWNYVKKAILNYFLHSNRDFFYKIPFFIFQMAVLNVIVSLRASLPPVHLDKKVGANHIIGR